MSRPRTCPQCLNAINPALATFDDELNLICPRCENIAFPTTPAAQRAVEAAIRARQYPANYQQPVVVTDRSQHPPIVPGEIPVPQPNFPYRQLPARLRVDY